jgi:hypothetical protein
MIFIIKDQKIKNIKLVGIYGYKPLIIKTHALLKINSKK